jgi:hypothetical protein
MSASTLAKALFRHASPEIVQNLKHSGQSKASRATTLQNNVAINGMWGAQGSVQYFQIYVPAGASNLVFRMSGGTGDADIYIRHGAAPTTTVHDYRNLTASNNETISVAAPRAGTWFVMVKGYYAYSNASLRASFSAPVELKNNVAVSGLWGGENSQRLFRINVPAGATNLVFRMSGGSGDADIYVRYGAIPTTRAYDGRNLTASNNEAVSFKTPRAGTWYVMINGYSAYSGVTLRASYATAPTNTNPVAGGTAADGRRETWAVLLGANDYAGTSSDLPDCDDDARNMSALLRTRLGVDANHQRVFTGGGNISEALIAQQFAWLRAAADADDTIIFYYSGHGGFGQNEFVDDNEYLALPSGESYTDSDMRVHLQAFPSTTGRVVMLDSCYSGGFIGLAKVLPSTMVLAASNFNQVSYSYQPGHTPNNMYGGIFTTWFIHGYNNNRADSNRDGYVTMVEAFFFAKPNAVYYGPQTPVGLGNVVI